MSDTKKKAAASPKRLRPQSRSVRAADAVRAHAHELSGHLMEIAALAANVEIDLPCLPEQLKAYNGLCAMLNAIEKHVAEAHQLVAFVLLAHLPASDEYPVTLRAVRS
jgi:hypothetical protein